MKHFGPVNQEVSIGGHTLVLLDAPGLVEEDYQRHGQGHGYDQWKPVSGGPVEFVKSIAAGTGLIIFKVCYNLHLFHR
jgi:ethanolamine phosphate phosphodiesterase